MKTFTESSCYKRSCVHYLGKEYDGGEDVGQGKKSTIKHICFAFPSGIPKVITNGENLHLKPLKNQDNNIVYEKTEDGRLKVIWELTANREYDKRR